MMQGISFLFLLSLAMASKESRAYYSLSRITTAVVTESIQQRADDIQSGKTTLSYSGDLDEIFALAEAVAKEEDAGIIFETVPPTLAPSGTLGTLKSCRANLENTNVEEISFMYSMETLSVFPLFQVQSALEDDMNDEMAKRFLNCDARVRRRSLQENYIAVIAIDSMPVDEPNTASFCNPRNDTTNKCTIINGITAVYLANGTNIALARHDILSSIRDYFPTASIQGLVIAQYLGPDIPNLSEVNTNTDSNAQKPVKASTNNDLSARSILLFSFAAVAFVSSIGAAMWFRKRTRNRNDDSEFDSTVGPILSPLAGPGPDMTLLRVDTNDDNEDFLADTGSDESDSHSPFSSILPPAYRLDEGVSQMDVVLEMNESFDDQASNILISEGWTTESDVDSIDVSNLIDLSRTSEVPVLGARRRKEDGSFNLLPPLDMA